MFSPEIWRFGRMMAPIPEIQNLRREMNRVFSGISQEVSQDFPAVNVWVGENDAIVNAEIPGVEIEKIDISVIADSLSISGSREPATLGEGESYYRQERDFGRFTRTLRLPFNVEADKVDARYENGVLSITLPRAEADKPKKVAIKTQ
ncbi:MAG: Hsp20/alpha crystallin family protein [Deltaproteobacteria bacterium]|nr:Hsp20/alpha crystallin family protein [Deltaproteobacteria bacterium]